MAPVVARASSLLADDHSWNGDIMQVTEIRNENLSREYKIVLNATEIEQKIDDRLREIGKSARRNGFRPGKVPMPILKREYGRSVRGEILERAVHDGTTQAIADQGIRPAMQPKIEVTAYGEGADLEFTVALEVMPEIAAIDYAALSLERLVPEIPEGDVDDAIVKLGESQGGTEPVADARPARSGDTVVIDFVGRVDGELFDGGTDENFSLELGSGMFVPGFEDQLVGASAGEERVVSVTMPQDYGAKALAGRDVVFSVTVKELRAPAPVTIDVALAEQFGFESLDAFRQAVRGQMERDYGRISRARLKRSLLDSLAEQHQFEVPPGMVDAEFESIWSKLQEELAANPDDAGDKSEDALREEYRGIAIRRVRLGLLLSEIGQKNDITVTNEDMNRAMVEAARARPGMEQAFLDLLQKSDRAADALRAPIFEDKVVDFILEMAQPTDRSVSVADLLRDPDDESAAGDTA